MAVAGPSSEGHDFLKILLTAADPMGEGAVPFEELSKSLGIEDVPTKEEALTYLEAEVLRPVRDLSGDELWRWQMYVVSII